MVPVAMLARVGSPFSEKVITHRTCSTSAAPPKARERPDQLSSDVSARTFTSERLTKSPLRHRRHQGRRGVRPTGIPAVSPQVDGEGRGEDDAQEHQERQPGLQEACTAGFRETGSHRPVTRATARP